MLQGGDVSEQHNLYYDERYAEALHTLQAQAEDAIKAMPTFGTQIYMPAP